MRWRQVTSKIPKMLSSMEMEKDSATSTGIDTSTTPKEDPLFSREVDSSSYLFALYSIFFHAYFFVLLNKIVLVSCPYDWDIAFLLPYIVGAESNRSFFLFYDCPVISVVYLLIVKNCVFHCNLSLVLLARYVGQILYKS